MDLNLDSSSLSEKNFEFEAKTRSSLRLRYEAEVAVFKRQNGDLEEIRARLGLSRRKICQLLFVDPSAWTRWTQPGQSAPPHIYRALDWYLAAFEKNPEYRRLNERFGAWMQKEKDYETRLRELESQVRPRPQTPLEWRSVLALILAFFAGVLATYFLVRPL